MGGGSGGGGNGGRKGGGGGSPEEQLMNNLQSGKLSIEESVAAERAVYRAQSDAFFKEKNYEKSAKLTKQYEAIHAVNEKYKLEKAAEKVSLKITGTRQGSSVRDEGPSGRQMTNEQIARNAAKLKVASKNLKTKGWSDDSTPYNPYG